MPCVPPHSIWTLCSRTVLLKEQRTLLTLIRVGPVLFTRAGDIIPMRDMTPKLTVPKLNVVHSAHTAPGHSQKNEISPGAAVCYSEQSTLKSVKSVSCVIPLSHVNTVTNAPNVVTNLPVGARLQKFWKKWLNLGAGPKVVQILKEGYTLPFRTRTNLSRIPSHKLL